eukprot:COSAG04_NODE_147_length_22902_cov_55.666184_15_plen_56_part_00
MAGGGRPARVVGVGGKGQGGSYSERPSVLFGEGPEERRCRASAAMRRFGGASASM